ncbi:phosphotransferase enzyme family protein [Nocardia sp. NPDC004068]|uniref:phosphotransferase enzyme family protein n=1 Tax=Nocardia sp. NPDC004068 TaxID=3364303 RepID=UPI00369AE7B7
MGADPVAEPDYPPLTLDEIDGAVEIEWRSPRPLSTTARVRMGNGSRVVVKRVPMALRDGAALAEEHRFMDHLRRQGIPVPEVRSWTRDGFSYEMQTRGAGSDPYRGVFSWTPYLSVAHAAASGRMLGRMHRAAAGYDAPARPVRPLTPAICTDPIATARTYAAARPALAAFLASKSWRTELAWPPIELGDLEPLWTHNDWHPTNLLWSGDEITAVFDFGLANRTTAVFDLAVAVERFAVDWLALPAGGPARVRADQLAAFLAAYRETRPLTPGERDALPKLFPLCHVAYELSEIDYFLSVLPRPNHENAEIAYRRHLSDRLRWAASPDGRAFTRRIERLTR